MPEVVWYRSLYWRVGLGFVALLAVLLLLQGAVFLWISGRMTDLFQNRSPSQLAAAIAADVGELLATEPSADIGTFVNERYARTTRGFVVMLRDGRVAASLRMPPPPQLSRMSMNRLRGGGPGGPGGPPPRYGPRDDDEPRRFGGPGPGPGRGRGFGPGPGQGPGPGGGAVFADVIVDGSVHGVVAVAMEQAPLMFVLEDLGPTLASVALVLLAVGTAVAAVVIIRPASQRLRHLQDTARALGAGEAGVRARVSGGDEVTSLATAFNEMATQLEDRAGALEQADRLRRQLLADVSHELNTPLAAIRGYVETLSMKDVVLDERTRDKYLGIVSDETERLEHIIGDLLDLAKVEGGGGAFRIESVPVAALFERVVHRHEPTAAAKQVAIETAIDPGVTVVTGDANRLEQVLQNLVANAVRHTPVGGRVTVRGTAAKDGVVLSVSDTGPGIPEDHLERVFDRFYKVDESRTGTPDPSGSGLGLSIVRAIVTRHGGRVTASNHPGGGARFEIWLPPPQGTK